MKKNIKLKGLDCANCAAKIERAVSKIKEVTDCRVNFMTQRMVLEAPDDQFDTILQAAQKAAKKVHADLVFVV
ncbi:MAG TPA: heavy metal transporter [Clostridiales bacterium]|nr:heavy metal transporter [Clostridiales bacterium]